ncbi:formylglycine-generating enzyme family protein [Pseudalkalibacillus hwajinpoensis]|uniref:Serine/threonine protein kinase n=1 Tax=Guptibacillus hwajinpoensis TaxID=208199 RepID=A0A4U1MG36_9BACL|nr:SUMF1/EgtB/PvdO family nonheme iron enzyme [Pseudalkalibacillus hwajinpoensis]TKD69240.1 serine/threonine protein kinase [Pseudalkalibacillus hwajinpoensis]
MQLISLANKKGELNNLSFREAMGLPEDYINLNIHDLSKEFNLIQKLDEKSLINVIESLNEPLKKRYAAGLMLNLLGDTRICTLDPQMVTIPSNHIYIGLDKEDVPRIVEQYNETGIIEEWIEKETPKIKVDVKTFKISKYPITNMEFKDFINDQYGEETPSSWEFGRYPIEKGNHPVYTITPETAENYAHWLSKKTGRKFRLPTEYEWEYAAGGADQLEFPWGNEFLENKCNTVEAGILDSTPVGIFPDGSSPFGVLDMAGNIEEYVADNYQPYSKGSIVEDDLLKKAGSYRVARGGSFTRLKDLARCKRRHGKFPSDLYVMGFRLAEDI